MANIDWSKLTFSYTKTNTILTTTFKDGAWTPVESHTDDYIKVSTFCGAFHYAIECFEGLKAFRGKDGRIRLFRPEENAKRLQRSAKFLGIEAPGILRNGFRLVVFSLIIMMFVLFFRKGIMGTREFDVLKLWKAVKKLFTAKKKETEETK